MDAEQPKPTPVVLKLLYFLERGKGATALIVRTGEEMTLSELVPMCTSQG